MECVWVEGRRGEEKRGKGGGGGLMRVGFWLLASGWAFRLGHWLWHWLRLDGCMQTKMTLLRYGEIVVV